ncbi:MAG: hypothetical protein LUH02_01120 [Erysipelotrichaceae bacterium]|nr:hypothetical protein [Erysipelotrichaceae bacterium]
MRVQCSKETYIRSLCNDMVVSLRYPGYMDMCNIGLNPTFRALSQYSLEVNILDFDEDIYGEYLKVEFML